MSSPAAVQSGAMPAGKPERSSRGRIRHAAARDPIGLVALIIGVIIVLAALLAPVLPLVSPTLIAAPPRLAPSWQHWLGTDQFGHDVLSRIVWGSRSTLAVAALSTVLAAVIGVPLGILAGYIPRWFSAGLIMRCSDVLLAFPGLMLALLVVSVLGAGNRTLVIAIGISFIPIFARFAFTSSRSVREQDYVAAARVVGCSPFRIMRSHVLPILETEILVLVSSAIGWAVLLAATLSFLGFGVAPPAPNWGSDLAAGEDYLVQAWWISATAGAAITLVILVSTYIGDFIAGLIDPARLGQNRRRIEGATVPGEAPVTVR
jgi:ABC-type dipeptide/oligopeptide/nickel transport system permease subunit